jgi:molecular chaperone GrpE
MDKKKTHEKKEKKEEVLEKDNLQFEKYEKKNAELEDQLKRAVADYRNLERRSFEERADAVRYANKNFIEALLPAFDTLFLAGKYTSDESVKLTIDRILEVLKDNGIEKIVTDNVKYNAQTMEVVEVVNGEKGMVTEEVRPGFTVYGKLIRPAQVKVGEGEEN